jgi:hypothetical protein
VDTCTLGVFESSLVPHLAVDFRNDTVVLPLRVLYGDFVDLAPDETAHDHQSDCGGVY